MPHQQRTLKSALSVLGDLPAVSVVLLVLIVISRSNYLLFHSLVEGGIAAASLNAFAFAWNSRRFEHGYLLLIGIAYLFNGLLGFLHALSYQGMGVFPNYDGANLAPQLWIASRYMVAITLLVAPYYFRRRLPTAPAFAILCLITTGLLAAIFTAISPPAT
ncbi:MAG: hypothetical protein EON56_04330 [Alphaproteobacteria bacterium]|nr:MAG: hypothetical protein EON56_04330 [Alphaproteobacteria bacterium]